MCISKVTPIIIMKKVTPATETAMINSPQLYCFQNCGCFHTVLERRIVCVTNSSTFGAALRHTGTPFFCFQLITWRPSEMNVSTTFPAHVTDRQTIFDMVIVIKLPVLFIQFVFGYMCLRVHACVRACFKTSKQEDSVILFIALKRWKHYRLC